MNGISMTHPSSNPISKFRLSRWWEETLVLLLWWCGSWLLTLLLCSTSSFLLSLLTIIDQKGEHGSQTDNHEHLDQTIINVCAVVVEIVAAGHVMVCVVPVICFEVVGVVGGIGFQEVVEPLA
jgi:hypothetical protein